MSDDIVLETRALDVYYGRVRALSNVSLAIHRDRITAIIGPSGCGKSSFLASLNRLTDLMPGCRVSGQVLLDGRDIRAPGTDVIDLRRRVGMVFQRPNPFPLSIRRNLDLPLRERGVTARADRDQRIVQVLREVGLWDEVCDRLDRPAQALSGGQKQRLCIARALVLEPDILLCDEPCSALDPIASGAIEELIARLCARITIVIVTHNLAQAQRIADRVAMFWVRDGAGTLIEAGPASEVFEAPRDPITAAYLDGSRG